MKNAHVLRMAAALLTPAEELASEESANGGSSDDGSSDGGSSTAPPSSGGTTLMSLTDGAVPTVSIVKVSMSDPMVAERLRLLLETAVRMLYCHGVLSGKKMEEPIYPLLGDNEFPLPDALASVAACYTAWLFTGEERFKLAWQCGLDGYLASLEAVIEPIVEKVKV